jgi:hypothetical protein
LHQAIDTISMLGEEKAKKKKVRQGVERRKETNAK